MGVSVLANHKTIKTVFLAALITLSILSALATVQTGSACINAKRKIDFHCCHIRQKCIPTKELDIKIVGCECWDSEDVEDSKRVGEVRCKIKICGELLVFKVKNAYPEYWATVKFDLKNVGHIPARIVRCEIVKYPNYGWLEVDAEEIRSLEGETILVGEAKQAHLTVKFNEEAIENSEAFIFVEIHAVQAFKQRNRHTSLCWENCGENDC